MSNAAARLSAPRRLGHRQEVELAGDDFEEDVVLGGLADTYRRCASLRAPFHQQPRIRTGEGGGPVFFERRLLPLAEDGGATPTHLRGMTFLSEPR